MDTLPQELIIIIISYLNNKRDINNIGALLSPDIYKISFMQLYPHIYVSINDIDQLNAHDWKKLLHIFLINYRSWISNTKFTFKILLSCGYYKKQDVVYKAIFF